VVIAAMILVAALMTVTARNLVHAALWLVTAFFSIGALYMLMQAEFVAIVQVFVYVGAIAVLILFAIMLTPDVSGESAAPIFRQRWIALVIAAALFGALLVPALYIQFQSALPPVSADAPIASSTEIGTSFVREYVLPFELASVLLLAAMIGAIVIGLDEAARRRILTLAEELRLRRTIQTQFAEPAPNDRNGMVEQERDDERSASRVEQ
jgi:NADH-quinone oxidoreductase subunit J